ncbi:MAG: HAMP domain-containing protein [Opitutaceae bacterium]|nr:HAMP domain-containing protein [Opitutaceae bacterium]
MLRTRLLLGFFLLLVLLSAVGAYAVWTTRELGRSVATAIAANARGLAAAQQLKAEVNRLGSALRQLRGADTPGGRAEFAAQQAACRAFLRERLAAPAGGAERARLIAGVDAALVRLADLAASPAAADLRPLELMKADEGALFAILQGIDALAARDAAEVQQAEAKAQRLTARTTAVFGAGVVVAVLLALVFGWALGRALLDPIRQLTASAAALGEGNLDRDVPVTSRDELGELARTFNTMAARLRQYRDALAAKALRAQRAMEATLTSAPDPLWLVARDGTPEVANPAAAALAAGPELAGGLPEVLRPPLREVLATGNHYLPTDYQRAITLGGRHYLPRILAIGDPLADFRGAAIVLQDVTKFRLLDDAKTNLVGTVSHELKTPLTSLRLAVYLLLEAPPEALTPRQRELLEQAREDADRLLRILDTLLDLSRIEGGVAAPQLETVPVAALLEGVAQEARVLYTASGHRLRVEHALAGAAVRADPAGIRHVFMNLLTNAAKYSPPGSEVLLYAGRADEGFLRFGVRDGGPGIEPEHRQRVFEKFYRVPGQTAKGAGLGLAICREIVVAHGGSIACDSAPGAGSDFHFLLPVAIG